MSSVAIKYKAEGLKNAVFEFTSSNIDQKVIRVRKRKKKETSTVETDDMHKLHHQEEIFYTQIMQRLITPKYCLPIQSISLDNIGKAKLQQALELASQQRAKRFIRLTELDLQFPSAFIMDDHTLCTPSSLSSEAVFCVEIKPKSGYVANSPLTSMEHTMKRKKCSYCLRQMLKLAEGDVDKASLYCPKDLFSNSPTRIVTALNSLLQNPQNNLKIFYKGSLCFTGKLGGKHNQMNIQQLEDLDSLLAKEFFSFKQEHYNNEKNVAREKFVFMLRDIIIREFELLRTIEEIQARDYFNIEVIHPFYLKLVELGYINKLEQFCVTPQEADLKPISPDKCAELQKILLLDSAELSRYLKSGEHNQHLCFRVIKDFLLATSLKDCSIMITLVKLSRGSHRNDPPPEDPSWSTISVPTQNSSVCVYYRVAIIDVDPKPLRNIPKYAEMDRTITSNAESIAQQTTITPCNQ